LISQGVPQLGASNTVETEKLVFIHARLSRSYLALARLSCYYYRLRTTPASFDASSSVFSS